MSSASPTLGTILQACLQRHRFILVVVPALFMLVSSVYVLIAPSHYEAFGLLEVTTHTVDSTLFSAAPKILPNDSLVLSEVEILRSPAVLQHVADASHQTLSAITDAITVAPVGRSFIIRVAATASQPEQAQYLATQVINAYQDHLYQLKTKHLNETTRWLNQHVSALAAQMRQSAQAAAAYRKQYNLDDGTADKQQINDLTNQFVKAQMDLTEAQAAQSSSEQAATDKALSQQMTSPVLVSLTQQDALLRQKIGELQQKYGTRHPDLQAAQAELAALHSKQQQEIARLGRSLKQDEQIASEKIDKLHRQFDLLQDKTHQDNAHAIQLQALDDEANINRALYESFLQRSKETSLATDLADNGAYPVSWPILPIHASNPNALLIILLSGIAGLLSALATLIVSEQLSLPFKGGDP